MTTVSENTAKEYMSQFPSQQNQQNQPIQPQISRMEYLHLLTEAFDEGKLMRHCKADQFAKAEFSEESFWAQYSPELVEEFYIAYRRGYIKGDG